MKEIEQTVAETDNTVSYGKFKSADALYDAYKNLEKEFTRKSQSITKFINNEKAVGEKLMKYVNSNPKLSCYAENIREVIGNDEKPDIVAVTEILSDKITTPTELLSDEQFRENFIYNDEKVKDKIIKEFLDGLSKKRLPKTVSKGQTSITPVHKPHSFEEAGKIAKKYIENRRI